MITITPKDALRSSELPPGWQNCKVENHYQKAAGTDGSTNHIYEIVIVEGNFKGVPLQDLIVSEKAVSMYKNFFIACGAPPSLWEDAKKGEAQSFDEKNPVDKFLKVYVTPTKFDNRMLNKATDFLAMQPQVAGV